MAVNVLAHLAQMAIAEGDEVVPFNEIHDAVAELIDAAQGVADNIVLGETSHGHAIRAALARCGGTP